MKYLLLLTLIAISCSTPKKQPIQPKAPEYGEQRDCCNRVWQIGHDTLYFEGYINK
jgi:hypothetical protein